MKKNIFNWAKKELTQDAVIATLLGDSNIGKKLLKYILSLDINSKKTDSNVSINRIEKVACQGYDAFGNSLKIPHKIDVYIRFIDNDRDVHHLIIEDKVDTDLRDNQVSKYIEGICKKEKTSSDVKIHFVLFKTGSYYFWQRDAFDKCTKSIGNNNISYHCMLIDDWRKFLKDNEKLLSKKYGWFPYYYSYIKSKSCILDWRHDLNRTVDKFVKETLGVEWSDNFDISLPEIAAGKRPYELKFYDYVDIDSNADKKNTSETDRERFTLLIAVELTDSCCYKTFINLNKYVNNRLKSGYSPRDKLNPLFSKRCRTYALELCNKYPDFSFSDKEGLKICSKKNQLARTNNNGYCFDQMAADLKNVMK